jgi:hypothetical protein
MSQYIGGVIAERKIFSLLCLLVKKTLNLAVAGGNGNRFFTQKLNVQIEKSPRSPQFQTDAQWLSSS